MTNDNVLLGYACPKCKSEGPFDIDGTALFLNVTDDGVTDFEQFEWSDDSTFHCVMCNHNAAAKEFQIK